MNPALRRERETVALTACAIGLTHDAAATHLLISFRTYRRYLRFAQIHLAAASTVHAVALAAATGQLDPEHLRNRTCPPWPTEVTTP